MASYIMAQREASNAHVLGISRASCISFTCDSLAGKPATATARFAQRWEARGEMIGGNDLWIAAHAKSAGLTLVTNNEREFKRVPDLSTRTGSAAVLNRVKMSCSAESISWSFHGPIFVTWGSKARFW